MKHRRNDYTLKVSPIREAFTFIPKINQSFGKDSISLYSMNEKKLKNIA